MILPKRTTVAQEIFLNSFIFLLITLILFSTCYAVTRYRSGLSLAKSIIFEKNRAVNYAADGYFSEIKSYIDILAGNEKIQNAPALDAVAREEILDLYRLYAAHNERIAYIYSGYGNGLLLINEYTAPDNYNPVDRPWYQSAVAAMPEVAVGTPYQEVNSKEWLIATGKAFVGEKANI